ncbi:MAG: B12-binding domain-containing radical SAM protein [Actinomycetia bacterium]|nr:B12-binding domain-containing radical SAM protein [Actinomycetes bacterium]
MILPALTEAKSPFWRPIKYSLFPPLGLATLAAHLSDDDEVVLSDEHVEELDTGDEPDVVVIQVYVTSARRAYQLADHYRSKGSHVCLGGLHVTSLPDEAAAHADTIFRGPGDESFSRFLDDFRKGRPQRIYESTTRTLVGTPPVRRDLIERERYLVPNSLVVSRGCPHHCTFCYKDAFFAGGSSFYTQAVDEALAEIDRLPGRHLYFLDDHLLGSPRFARALFDEMQGMDRRFQGAATVDSILRGDLIERAAKAGLRSVFIGFESLSERNLVATSKRQNLRRDYSEVVARLSDLGVMINGSFVFGLDGDEPDVFDRTADWAVDVGLTTATFHIATPYPGTEYHAELERAGRILHRSWDLYDTRHAVFEPRGMTIDQLEAGYRRSYEQFYSWRNIFLSAGAHADTGHRVRQFLYAAGWKKFEPAWNYVIKAGQLNGMLPLLENILAGTRESTGATAVRGAEPKGSLRSLWPQMPSSEQSIAASSVAPAVISRSCSEVSFIQEGMA